MVMASNLDHVLLPMPTLERDRAMSKEDHSPRTLVQRHHSLGAAILAESAVSQVSQQQIKTAAGARQFIVEHMTRAALHKGEFSADSLLDELRGHRLSVDAVIDVYVPATARRLGEMWMDDDIDFASVTVGSMRLQTLLSLASSESLEFSRGALETIHALVVVPECEQHSLGAFVLAAQLRRLGVRADMSFCETRTDLISRILSAPPDTIMFTASTRGTLEMIGDIVLDISNVARHRPLTVVGGGLSTASDPIGAICGVDLVTNSARSAVSAAVERKRENSG